MTIITQLLEKNSKIKISSNQLRHVEKIKRCSNFFSYILQVREGYMNIRMLWQIWRFWFVCCLLKWLHVLCSGPLLAKAREWNWGCWRKASYTNMARVLRFNMAKALHFIMVRVIHTYTSYTLTWWGPCKLLSWELGTVTAILLWYSNWHGWDAFARGLLYKKIS